MRKKIYMEPIKCHTCGLQVIGRGGDSAGWRAVQVDPDVAELRWFCMKEICQQFYRASFQEAQILWAKGEVEIPEPQEPEPEHSPLPPSLSSKKHEVPVSSQPSELVAYETADQGEAGWKDEVVEEGKVPYMRLDDEAPSKPLAPKGRYVPKPSAESKAKFVRRKGTGEKEKEKK